MIVGHFVVQEIIGKYLLLRVVVFVKQQHSIPWRPPSVNHLVALACSPIDLVSLLQI